MSAPLSARTVTIGDVTRLAIELIHARGDVRTAYYELGQATPREVVSASRRANTAEDAARGVEDRLVDLVIDLIALRDGLLPADSTERAS